MAVPITNMKISDIVNELGEVTSNITLRNLHLSPKVIGSGLDPTYCSGADGYERLANLRDLSNIGGTRELRIGKFRNYETPSVFYKLGFLYNGNSIYYTSISNSIVHIAIPSGWHLPTELDWLGIIDSIQSGKNFSDNTVLPYLRSIYTRLQLSSLGISPNPSWDDMALKYDTYGFKTLANGYGVTNDDNIVNWVDVGNSVRYWSQRSFANVYQAALFNSSTDRMSFDLNPGDMAGNQGDTTAYHAIRLFKDDSNDVGYMEDIQGNIYSTVKIGDYVIMAEGLRTTIDRFGNNLYQAFDDTENANVSYPCYIDTTRLDIP